MKTILLQSLLISGLLLGAAGTAWPQGTAFTYHGRLDVNGSPANGSYDLIFSVYDAPNVGNQAGSTLTNTTVGVNNGVFTVRLDFGPGIFTGPDRWLEMGVSTNGAGDFTLLSPRQRLTPTPYAIMANTASNLLGSLPVGQLTGTLVDEQLPANIPRLNGDATFTGTVSFNNPANSFTGNGSGLTGLNPASFGPGTAPIDISGNAATAGSATTAATATSATTATTAGSAATFTEPLAGDVTGPQGVTIVANVGGQSAAQVASGAIAANAATPGNIPDTLVRRDSSGNFAAGAITATSVTGDGSGLSALNASELASGILADGRLSSNVGLLNAHQSFSGSNHFSGVVQLTNADNTIAGTFGGKGNNLTELNPSNLAPGTAAINISGNAAFATNAATAATAITAITFTGPLVGDVTGNQGSTIVERIRGVTVAAVVPTPNQFLKYDGTDWSPGAVALGADVSGILPVANGGTGAASPSEFRDSLGLAASGANADITSLTGLTAPLSLGQGGTGSDTKNFVDLFSDQTIAGGKIFSPTNDVSGVVVRQTTADSPTNDIFQVQDRTGTTNFLRVDANGEFSWNGKVSDDRLSTNVAFLNGNPTFSGNVSVLGDLYAARLNVGFNNNLASPDSTIGGGTNNLVSGVHLSTIAGGANNSIYGSTGPPLNNDSTQFGITISGGSDNYVNAGAPWFPSSYTTISGGNSNSAGTSWYGTIGGGLQNNIFHYSRTATIGGGYSNSISGTSTTIAGGQQNYIYGDSDKGRGNDGSTIGGGSRNAIQQVNRQSPVAGGSAEIASTIAGGFSNQIDYDYYDGYGAGGTIGGGASNLVKAPYSTIPGGVQALARNYGQLAYASGAFADTGDAQTSVYVCRGTTTNDTQIELFLDGVSQRMTVPVDATWGFDALVTGRAANGDSAAYQIRGAIKNNAGTTTLVGSPTVSVLAADPAAAAWNVNAFAGDTFGVLRVDVIGAADTAIRWVASIRTVEVAY